MPELLKMVLTSVELWAGLFLLAFCLTLKIITLRQEEDDERKRAKAAE